MSGTFSPGQAAQQSGFSIDTLRYYEKIGLITIDRRTNGHREFNDDDFEWLGVLRCLRDTGMPIADMLRGKIAWYHAQPGFDTADSRGG